METYGPVIVTMVVALVRRLWFSRDTTARDRVLPLLVLVGNLLLQIASALSAPGGSVADVAPSQVLGASAVSVALHRLLMWLSAFLPNRG